MTLAQTYRLPAILVALFAMCSITAGCWALMVPACDSMVSLYVKIVTIAYSVELLICFVRYGITRGAKKLGEKWITVYEGYTTFLYYSLLSAISLAIHVAWMAWGFVEVNVCNGSNYRGAIVVLVIISLMRMVLNGIYMFRKNVS